MGGIETPFVDPPCPLLGSLLSDSPPAGVWVRSLCGMPVFSGTHFPSSQGYLKGRLLA